MNGGGESCQGGFLGDYPRKQDDGRFLGVGMVTIRERYLATREVPSNALHLSQTAMRLFEGEVRMSQGDREVTARKGDWVFLQSTGRRQVCTPGTLALVLAVQIGWPDGRFPLHHGLPLVVASEEAPGLETACLALKAAFDTKAGIERHFAMQVATFHWLLVVHRLLSERGVVPDERPFCSQNTTRILEALQQWPLYQPYNAREISRRLGYSRTHFERLCAQGLGRSPKEVIDSRRLKHAMNALRYRSVKEVAADIGFRHASTFSAWFRKQTGHAPSDVAGEAFFQAEVL